MSTFDRVKGRFGFGCMRLPMNDDKVNYEIFSQMIDTFLEAGFNYFDTAHGYLDGKSEIALRECLCKRYPRDKYILANKLSNHHFEKNEDIRPLFEEQLRACGVDYFDFYLMHAQNANNYEKYKKCRAYETALELLAEGKVKHLGISFHDTPETLEKILTDYPQVETVQIQFNYVDYEDASVQSRKVYEVCRRHNKPIIVMEPVKGGSLVNLPDEAKQIFDSLGGGSYASYAIRFAAGFEGIEMVLSGMGDMDMMRDNLGFMTDFKPLDDRELSAVNAVCEIFRSKNLIACTNCRYCTERCPKDIPIPNLFACMNDKKIFQNWASGYYYSVHAKNGQGAADCIKCGQCEAICPQHLPIRSLLEEVAEEFKKE